MLNSQPAGISCTDTCQENFVDDSNVTLTAMADQGSYFAGWTGDCAGAGPVCTLNLDAAKTATAQFIETQASVGSCQPLNDDIGEVVEVSNAAELTAAVEQINSGDGMQTILLQDGDYLLSSNQGLTIRQPNVLIRSASGDREAVVVRGQGMTGSVGYVFKIAADDVVIADITIGGVSYHPIQIHGELDADRTIIHNVRIYDGNEQFVKGSYDHNGSPDLYSEEVVVQCSLFEYPDGHSLQRYTGAIDVHHGEDWLIRDNTFRSIRSMSDGPTQDHAVHFWSSSARTIIERNTFYNCDRGIGLGETPTSPHIGGVIRNNFIYNDGQGNYNDVGIIVAATPDVQVINNTIYFDHDYPNAIEYRYSETVDGLIANNLTNRAISSRDGGQALVESNITNAQAVWFTDASVGDIHLDYDVVSVVNAGQDVAGLLHDIDLEERGAGQVDIGADEKQDVDPRTITAVSLTTDTAVIHANGRDQATFSVEVTYSDATGAPFVADAFVAEDEAGDPVTLQENSLTTYTEGVYRVRALVGGLESNEVTVEAQFDPTLVDSTPTGLQVRHRSGQTFVTWTEINDIIGMDEIAYRDFFDIKNAYQRDIRYRIYRAGHQITDVANAELVGEVEALSGWNTGYYGTGTSNNPTPAIRYAVEDLGTPVGQNTGVFVHNPDQAGQYHYAVTAVVDGQENTSIQTGQNSTTSSLTETIGQGTPVLQRKNTGTTFNYISNADVHIYTRWEDRPNTNREGKPYDYLVAIPENMPDPAPVGIHFHCWGGSMFRGLGWWFDGKEGSILISSNQDPYDWWTGYHEDLWTADHPQSQADWENGVVRPYSANRMRAFYEWVRDQSGWNVDDARVFTAGQSMGGSGSIMFAIRYPEFSAWNSSWVGVHVPSMSPNFESSYR